MARGGVNVSLIGAKETIRKLRKIRPEVEKEIKLLVRRTAAKVKRDAKDRAPVLSGEFRRSITRRSRRRGMTAVVGSKAPHAAKVEFGAPGIDRDAQPTIFPVAREARTTFQVDLFKALRADVPKRVARNVT